MEVCFKFLVYLFRLTISLRVIGGGEGNIIFQEMGKFLCEGRGKLGASIRDDSVMEAKSGEDMVKKDVGNVGSGGSFVTGMENYPL